MEPRRPGTGARAVSDPQFRLVGFVTAQDRANSALQEMTATATATATSPFCDMSPASNSISPVMIPLPRHTTHSHAVRRHPPMLETMHVGSYNPVESFLEMSPVQSPPSSKVSDGETNTTDSMSWHNRSNSGRFDSSFPNSGFDFPSAKGSNAAVDATTEILEVDEKRIEKEKEVQNENSNPKPVKQKMTKSERRALQEFQRAAKAAAKGVGSRNEREKQSGEEKHQPKKEAAGVHLRQAPLAAAERAADKERKKEVPPPRMQFDDKSRVDKAKKRAVVKQTEVRNRVELFSHLPQYEHGTQLPDLESKFFQLDPMHPAVYKVGLRFMAGDISGGNGRCVAMLEAFREVISDYTVPVEKTLVRDLTVRIGGYVSFLIECRPLSISMGNAIRFLKNRIAKLGSGLSEAEARAALCSDIDRFIGEKIVLAGEVIVRRAASEVHDGDVVLTYGCSQVVGALLVYARGLGIRFRVVLVDSRPKFEGREMLRKLIEAGIACTYAHINAVSYVMHEVTRVFLGAASIFSNGTVYSRVGTACVAMVAHAFGVPILVCCEAYKFHERVQLDSICFNELGDPGVISRAPGGVGAGEEKDNLQHLNLLYDLTPADYVSMIVTDYGMTPPTSVPVIVHDYRQLM